MLASNWHSQQLHLCDYIVDFIVSYKFGFISKLIIIDLKDFLSLLIHILNEDIILFSFHFKVVITGPQDKIKLNYLSSSKNFEHEYTSMKIKHIKNSRIHKDILWY